MSFVRGHYRRTSKGVSYVRPSIRRGSGGGGAAVAAAIVLVIVLVIVTTIVKFVIAHWLPIFAALLLAAGVFAAVVLRGKSSGWRGTRYLELARDVAQGKNRDYGRLAALAARVPSDDQERIIGEEEIYATLVAEILADGEVSDEECERLTHINEVFVFDTRRALEIRQEAFDGFMSWVGIDLSGEQEVSLRDLALRLDVSRDRTDHWLSMVAHHRAEGVRQVEREAARTRRAEREREVEQVRREAYAAERKRTIALEAERAQLAAQAAEQERRTAIEAERARLAALEAEEARLAALTAERERQAALDVERAQRAEHEAERARQAVQATERDRQTTLALERERAVQLQHDAAKLVFAAETREPIEVSMKLRRGEQCWFIADAVLRERKNSTRTGTCLVTNKRLLFEAERPVSINLSRMLDVAADPTSGVLRIIKNGRKSPYEIELDQPLVALAHLERSLVAATG